MHEMSWYDILLPCSTLVGIAVCAYVFRTLLFDKGLRLRSGFRPHLVMAAIIAIVAFLITLAFRFVNKVITPGLEPNGAIKMVMSDSEGKDDLISSLAPLSSGSGTEGDSCCGGLSNEERDRLWTDLDVAWREGSEGLSPIGERLPPRDALQNAETSFRRIENSTVVEEENEIDWDTARLDILDTLHGVEKAGVAAMMLEADQFIRGMTDSQAKRLAVRADAIWEREVKRVQNLPANGPEAALFKKVIEITAALELMDADGETQSQPSHYQRFLEREGVVVYEN